MATNLALDDFLIEEAKRLGHHKSKKDAVNQALAEYIQRKKQLSVIDSFGSFDFDENYNHKKERNR